MKASRDSSMGEDGPAGVERSLRQRVLLPLGLVLALLIAAFAFALYDNERTHVARTVDRDLATMQSSLNEAIALRGAKLRMALALLERNPEFRAAFASRNRDRLQAEYGPLFERFKREFNITHFYLIDPDRVALLRLHQPERFGDRIDRFTALEAERTGRIAVGTELGPLGTLSLRAVMPLFDGGRLLGYVELAEEVLDVVRDLGNTFRCECFVFIHKNFLFRAEWEKGMRMLGRQGEWDRFPQSVLVAQTLPEMPGTLGRLFPEGEHSRLSAMDEIAQGDRIYRAGFIPLSDALGREVGDIAVLHDITAAKAHTRQVLVTLVAASLAAGLSFLLLFHMILGRVQHALAASRRRLAEEAQAHASHQQQRMEEMAAWAEEQRRVGEELRIAAIAFESQEGMFVTDAKGVILRINRAFSELTGYGAEETIGRTPALLKSGHHDEDFYRRMREALSRDGVWQGEIWNRRKNGEVFPEWQTISAVTDDAGRVTHYVSAFSDITRHKRAEAEIQRLAYHDHLTGLPNRRLLLDRLGQALAGSARQGRHGALLFIDLDHFKTLNDTRGHEAGDQLLIEVSRRLLSCMREGDTVARLGGDEFMIMLEDLSEDRQEAAAQTEAAGRKILSVLDAPVDCRGGGANAIIHHCSASIGAVLFLGRDTPVDELFKHADLSLYQAKDAGRNTLRFFDPAMQATLEAHAALQADLRRAALLNQFELFYQAQIGGDGRLLGAEALLRWNHPERGRVPPTDFIPLAEETGLIVPIGHWVLETACRQLRTWAGNAATRDLRLAVNVSARQFRLPDFVDQVQAVLEMTGADPTRLKLELTESLVLDDLDDAIGKMGALKSLGVSFSMDDFGTGYSSLSSLKHLPLDQLKIDRSFVRDIAVDPSDAVIVRTIIVMAESLGLDVIAEGVETVEQRDFLDRNGCSQFQGYLFGRPLPLDEFENFLLNR